MNDMDKPTLDLVERRIRVLDSNRNIFVGKAETQHRWLKSSEKTFRQDSSDSSNALNIARHAGELAIAVAKIEAYNEAMLSLNEIFKSLGGRALPHGVKLTVKPKYKR